MTMDANVWKEFGLNGLIMCAVLGIMVVVIKRALDHSNNISQKILEQAAEERKNWVDAVARSTRALDEHTIQAREFHIQVKEEHKRQIDAQDAVCKNLAQVEQALGRINGYKDGHRSPDS